jgi:hypothetical protein
MNWKYLAMAGVVIGLSTGLGYYQDGPDEALRCFLLSVCGFGAGYCAARLLAKKS